MTSKSRLRSCAACALLLASLAGCSSLQTAATPPPAFYSLDTARLPAHAARTIPPALGLRTMIVNPPHAAAGFDSNRIIYVRSDHRIEYFAHSEWADTPARMLAPLIIEALEHAAVFRAVVLTPSAAAGDVRLDTEIVRLQHDFSASPSRVRFTLRAYVVDDKSRTVLARREFDASIPSASEDPYGGVLAANAAVQSVLADLAAFCATVSQDPLEPNRR